MMICKRTSCSGKFSILAFILLSLSLVVLPGCSTMHNMLAAVGLADDVKAPVTPESVVAKGMEAFKEGEYSDALKIFEKLRDDYPFSQYSLLADLKAADCRYYMNDYAEALDLYEEFESNHPTNEAIPYVLFQIGMCSYKQIGTVDRDTSGAVKAMQAFSRLLKFFPESPYTNEVKARILAGKNFLARHEMYVAAYFVRTEEFKQAEMRLKYLLSNYPEADECVPATKLLAAIQSGNPPRRNWRDWIPDLSLPDWETFASGLEVQGAGGSSTDDSGGL
ncbi:MAG: outer membrane protein assembly factor BamD [Desulfobulbaceae bacterium]|nr:outer membrane protein assembly factor BamD [Desulfobulbaceae bacterium]